MSTDQDVTVSRILTGEIDRFEHKSENIPSNFQSVQEPSTTHFPGVQYNNCTINMFGPTRNAPSGLQTGVNYTPTYPLPPFSMWDSGYLSSSSFPYPPDGDSWD